MNDRYLSISQYIECRQTLKDKIVAMDNLISSMELRLIDAGTSAHLIEYAFDDGQMKTKAVYRNPKELAESINYLEQLRQRYINRLNGRVKVLRGGNL